MTASSYSNGNLITWDPNGGRWYYPDGALAISSNRAPTGYVMYREIARPCPRCGRMPTPEGYDACLGHIPGAISACCGHGVTPGYVMCGAALTSREESRKEVGP